MITVPSGSGRSRWRRREGQSWPSAGPTRGLPGRAQRHEVRSVSFKLAWVATALPAAVPRSCSTGPRGAGRSETRRDRLTCACRSAGDGSGPRFRDLQRSQGGLPQVLPGVDARAGYRTCAQAPAEPARRPVLAYPSRSEERDLIAPASRERSRACVLVAALNLSRRRGRRGKPCNQCGFMAIPMSWASRCGERRWSGRRNRTCVTSFKDPALWVDK